MKGMSTYGAVATKIRGMRSHLLTTEDYTRIASAGSVRDIAVFLKGHPSYAPVLEDLDLDNMRRESFERMILRSVFRDFEKIAHFLDRKRKDLLEIFATQYELRFINNLIRGMHNRYTDLPDLNVYRPMYEGSPNFNFDKAIRATDIDSLITALEGSPYREPIYRVRKNCEDAQLFDYETALSRFYFAFFWEGIKKTGSSEDADVMLDIFGNEIDMLNIIWIYRAKAYYKIEGKDIYSFLIPVHYHLKPAQTARMVSAPTAADVMKIVEESRYAKYFNTADPQNMESDYRKRISKMNARIRRDHPYSFAAIGAYAHDKKTEVDRIVRITESVRYGYDPKLILDALEIQR